MIETWSLLAEVMEEMHLMSDDASKPSITTDPTTGRPIIHEIHGTDYKNIQSIALTGTNVKLDTADMAVSELANQVFAQAAFILKSKMQFPNQQTWDSWQKGNNR